MCSFKYKFFNSVERSSFECQEEASGAAKSWLVSILNMIGSDSGACFWTQFRAK